MSDYDGFEGYFYSRKGWIFGFLALLFLVDVGDTLIKGLPLFSSARSRVLLPYCVVAGAERSRDESRQSALSSRVRRLCIAV